MGKKTAVILLAALALLGAGLAIGAAAFAKPKTVLHIITLKWKEGTTDAQKKTAIDGIEKMASNPTIGITRVWLKTTKAQGVDSILVMEFKDAKAFEAYADNPAHKEWEKVYLPVRGESRTHDVTNE